MRVRIVGLNNDPEVPREMEEAFLGQEFDCTLKESPEAINPVTRERMERKPAYLISLCTGLEALKNVSQEAYDFWRDATRTGFCGGFLFYPETIEVLQ